MLSHLDSNQHPTMVQVGAKAHTERRAVASGQISMSQEAYNAIVEQTIKKGPVLQTAIIAAIMGAKQTSALIPLCHPLNLSGVQVEVQELEELCAFKLFVSVTHTGQTGVEMEALMGVSVGLLTIYDMAKALDKGMVISGVRLESKSGGKSGDYRRV
ncbi:cyclic pyranopterin monophosphate synthase MoaC [Helicobacter heilmannii]|uniref:cyclic pyranopterin monophosphate synthase n=1 Tax=Helicobacter heilmannii TaxID=35817 RepID=A0A0K2Y9L4_HELHE|nr:cyclic pyranopterin monophosphate synthase MoaC [Helicobacter heilmannii]BDQ27035.1 cyclic pyranopterin monophosphate synthase accessory protein [Helicobacter heilmannii]CCM11982.1 Molybdenum cofactor biosynthesis protein MoaC [Helicobacter heilmannii ASB1.4]CRI34384.1 Molybdenum cofactor biosynthesis protein MoaC [Helicobacter heilmannii]